MATFSNARVHYGLQLTGTPTKTLVSNDQLIGLGPSSFGIAGPVKGYTTKIHLGVATMTADGNIAQNTWSFINPVSQVETATAAGTITGTGNATVIVTGARITGSPITLSVPVVSGDTASVWAGKVRTALAANSAISSVYTVSGTGASIVLTETRALYNNDSTLNISLNNGTCTGITPATTSADTTAGEPGAIAIENTGDGKDFEGVTLGTIAPKAILVRSILGSANFYTDDDYDSATLSEAGDFLLLKAGVANNVTFYSLSEAIMEITVIGTF